MPVTTVNSLVKVLVELGTSAPVRLAEPDREDDASIITVTYKVSEGVRDQTLDGFSGLEFWTYTATVRGRDPSEVETESRAIQDAIDALAVNYTVDNFVIQHATTSNVSDEDRPETAGDQFQYQYSFTITLVIGRAA